MLLFLCAGLPLMLGVIKCGVRIATRINGFLSAEPTSKLPLVDGPLIAYDEHSAYTPSEMAELVSTALQQQKDIGNPVIAEYLTVFERAALGHASQLPESEQQQQQQPSVAASCCTSCSDNCNNSGSESDCSDAGDDMAASDGVASVLPEHAVPVVPGHVARHILQRVQQRNTTAVSVEETQARLGMAAVMHTGSLTAQEELAEARKRRNNHAYFAGEVQRRGSAVQQLMCTATGLTTIADLTVDLAIFPYLFPTGEGHFDGTIRFSEYIKMRSMQVFSRFTLVREYMLVMIQVSHEFEVCGYHWLL
jgi:hypothetical protein